ncbi:hypothetical protein BDP27DRAFT_1322947 [Rhodocollybia butyracea]|uniref:Uncharacterized protein n=1 Tax=Rhodocollybia butyracea TaxID=206335 RepID=A0A9P5PZA6_9AGAR|nr:hypothetical protein BDP27DRAFT_1322947 [Rhodocollybia butyracea]
MLLFTIFSLMPLVLGQTTITVTVGDDGSFYDPPTVAAGMNDIINFVFTGLRQHSVTQSSLETPCLPLAGGFNSGLTSLSNSTDPTEAPVWQLQITNASIPIYFFCTQSTPLSHCSAGMVGAINPPSQDVYSSLVSLAKNTTSTVTSLVPYAATGIGAVAQQTLALSSVGIGFLTAKSSITHVPTSTPSTTSTPTSTPTGESSHGKKSDTGAIVGGAVGGALGVGLMVIGIVILLLRRHRRVSQNPPGSSQMYQQYYTPPPTAGISDRGMSGHVIVKPDSGMIPVTMPSLPHHQISPSGVWSTGNDEPRIYSQPPYASNRTTGYTVFNPDESIRDQSPPGSDRLSDRNQNFGGTDINALAKEVAAVILQHSTDASGDGISESRQTVDTTAKVRLQPQSGVRAPPQYQTNE